MHKEEAIVIKKITAAWQWTGGEKAYGDNNYQKAAVLFAKNANSFPDWGMTHFWRLRIAIQTRDLKQAELHLVKCRETLPQLEELLNRWEILLKNLFKKNKKQIADELTELDTYTDEQLQNKWEKPQWSWKSISIVIAILLVTYFGCVLFVEVFVKVLFNIKLNVIIENILSLFTLWCWWKYRNKMVSYSEPFMVWFFTGTRICIDICKKSRLFHILLAFTIINAVYCILFWDTHGGYEHDTGKNFFGLYSGEAPIYPIAYIIRQVLVAPLLEEIIFRETLFSFFREKWKRIFAYVLISILFTLMHVDYITDDNSRSIMIVFISSLVLSWFYEKYRHIFASILIHAVANGSVVLQEMTIWYLIYSKVQ